MYFLYRWPEALREELFHLLPGGGSLAVLFWELGKSFGGGAWGDPLIPLRKNKHPDSARSARLWCSCFFSNHSLPVFLVLAPLSIHLQSWAYPQAPETALRHCYMTQICWAFPLLARDLGFLDLLNRLQILPTPSFQKNVIMVSYRLVFGELGFKT